MDKIERRFRRKKGIRKKIYGTADKPRITVYRSNKHLWVQAVDDKFESTLSTSSDVENGVRNNKEGALRVGVKLADKLKQKKIKNAVFDRNGFIYHGVVKAVADGLRKGGIKV